MWVKQWDPPTASPPTPEFVDPMTLPPEQRNPVPDVMANAGLQNTPSTPFTVQRDLLHQLVIPTWENTGGGGGGGGGGNGLLFFTFRDKDNPATSSGNYPGATIRVPRGVLFHCETEGKGPPPHTIHWHGIEPTPMNDGVGHCSMEIGHYIYQWQPNQIGTYFMHCHRNTVQHFEFGLFSLLIIHPPDAFFATKELGVKIGTGRDGTFRTAANAENFPQFPEFFKSAIEDGDPRAYTVPYDVEAFWVFDDRDSTWATQASDARAFFPSHGSRPGINDNFVRGFFNDYLADYWFVTGVPVVPLNGIKTSPNVGMIDPKTPPIDPRLNSGVEGTQVPISATVGQTILVRNLCAAYNSVRITYPLDVVIIAFDGRALGVPPFGSYNRPFLLPAGTPIQICTARRFDALINSPTAFSGFAKVEFLSAPGAPSPPVVQTAMIPITIS